MQENKGNSVKKEVVKASAAIQIPHKKITLVQQQLWNILLANAYRDLQEKEEFSISVSDLQQYLGKSTTASRYTGNFAYLKQCLVKLRETTVEYNLFDKDSTEWGAFGLIAEPKIKNGVCTYRYDKGLRERLANPVMYAKISLLIQQKFGSKYSLFLYELCFDYKKIDATKWLSVRQFREYMGIDANAYNPFKKLKAHVIVPAIDEINSKSDLYITLETKREGRAIAALRFCIQKNQAKAIEQQAVASAQDAETVAHEPKQSTLYDVLESEYGIVGDAAAELVQTTTEADLRYAMDAIAFRAEKGKIENNAGVLISAIRSKWTFPDYNKHLEKQRNIKQSKEDDQQRERQAKEAKAQEHQEKLAVWLTKSLDERITECMAGIEHGGWSAQYKKLDDIAKQQLVQIVTNDQQTEKPRMSGGMYWEEIKKLVNESEQRAFGVRK